MPSYNCQYCRHEFRQKVDLDRHLNKKNGCIPVNKVISITSQTGEVHSIFKTCLDHLRNDAEHLVGDEALTELSRFIILKQIEQHIESGLIDIYDMNKYSKDTIKKYGTETFKEYLEYVKFTKFVGGVGDDKKFALEGFFNPIARVIFFIIKKRDSPAERYKKTYQSIYRIDIPSKRIIFRPYSEVEAHIPRAVSKKKFSTTTFENFYATINSK